MINKFQENDFDNQVDISGIKKNYNKNGSVSSYEVTISLDLINEYKVLKKKDIDELRALIDKTLISWEKKYKKHLEQEYLAIQNQKAKTQTDKVVSERNSLKKTLHHTLDINDTLDFEALKINKTFTVNPSDLFQITKPSFIEFNNTGKPVKIHYPKSPIKPTLDSVKKEMGFIKRYLFPKKIEIELLERTNKWEALLEKQKYEIEDMRKTFKDAFVKYMELKKSFEIKSTKFNTNIDSIKKEYFNKKPDAIEKYCDLVLESSIYPDWMPKNWILQYNNENNILIVEYNLPSPSLYPSVDYYVYDNKTEEIIAKSSPEKTIATLYDDLIYQIALRTMHELFESDVIDAIKTIGFNGIVTSLNKGTGLEETKMIMSVLTEKKEFEALDLQKISPKNSFKHLKGISAASLMDLTPIAPQIKIDRCDKRFVMAQEVIDGLDQSINLASMHWEDFEHLIRELFEKEFLQSGGEVKVTQASSDGGVDAIAFDPDPVRGGKIVIQAKRYTNIVGVAAVRDLYGTVLNEGATKGILVTTSDFGKDSYTFSQNKPLTLINGSNLLAMLEKHGHKARINIQEAKEGK